MSPDEEHVCKIVELVGFSASSIEDAIQAAITRAPDVAERAVVQAGQVAHYQVRVRVGFTLDG